MGALLPLLPHNNPVPVSKGEAVVQGAEQVVAIDGLRFGGAPTKASDKNLVCKGKSSWVQPILLEYMVTSLGL